MIFIRQIVNRYLAPVILVAMPFIFAACGSGDSSDSDSDSIAASSVMDGSAARPEIKSGPRCNDRIRINPIGRLAEVFNDSNHVHLVYAKALGIKPIQRPRDAFFTDRPVVRIESCENYEIDKLTHSVPYLVPEAAALLDEIGRNFIDSLASRGADGYKVLVTSVLRTPASVSSLRRVNRNATKESTHQYATTFDISYSRFCCLDSTRTIAQEDLKNLLGEVLRDLRDEGRCLVKYERKSPCYHITVAR